MAQEQEGSVRLVIATEHRPTELQLVPVLVGRIRARDCKPLLAVLGSQPPHELGHLKRIRSVSQSRGQGCSPPEKLLDVLLCPTSPDTERADRTESEGSSRQGPVSRLPAEVAALIPSLQASLRQILVPKQAPDCKEKWMDWSQVSLLGGREFGAWLFPKSNYFANNMLWPLHSHRQHDAKGAVLELASAEKDEILHYMQQVLRLSASNQQEGGCMNAALLVDPRTAEVIAEGCDRTEQGQAHRLGHAVMAALSAAAERDCRLWPDARVVHPWVAPGGGSALSGIGHRPVSALSLGGVQGGSSPSKRQLQQDSSDSTSEELRPKRTRPECVSASGPALSRGLEGTATRATAPKPADGSLSGPSHLRNGGEMQGRGQQAEGEEGSGACQGISPVLEKPYLCTGLDCYVYQEPCMMCAMALTHSRVRRVVYCVSDREHGALGGRWRLHGVPSLNHHYEVLQAAM